MAYSSSLFRRQFAIPVVHADSLLPSVNLVREA
jgi:hypothetical protein